MRNTLLLTALLLGAPLLAGAQAIAAEAVYSDAQRSLDETASSRMVQTVLATSFTDNEQYVRWQQPICPHVSGLAPAAAQVIESRIRAVAAKVGAPVESREPCVPNISIIVSSDPQASLLSIFNASPYLVVGGDQKQVVRYPVEAWYATLKTNYKGVKTIDIPERIANTSQTNTPANLTRLRTGQKPEMAAVTILANTKALIGMQLGELADYVTLLSLAQTAQYGACQPVETIANLFVQGCAAANVSHKLSRIDMALLRGLYEAPDGQEQVQARVVGAMRRSLEKQFGKE